MQNKQFNKELHDGIIALRKSRLVSKNEYEASFELIMSQFNLSQQTVYREMAKEVPGLYRSTKRNPAAVKITNKELEVLSAMTITGKSDREMIKVLSAFKDFKYTPGRLQKAKKKLFKQKTGSYLGTKSGIFNLYDPESVNRLKVTKIYGIGPVYDSSSRRLVEGGSRKAVNPKHLPKFTGDASRLFSELAKVSYAEPDKIYKLEFLGTTHYVHGLVIKQCLELLAASSVNGGADPDACSLAALRRIYQNYLKYAESADFLKTIELKQLANIHKLLSDADKKDDSPLERGTAAAGGCVGGEAVKAANSGG